MRLESLETWTREGILRLGMKRGREVVAMASPLARAKESEEEEKGEGCLRVNRGVEDCGGAAGGQRDQEVLHVSL